MLLVDIQFSFFLCFRPSSSKDTFLKSNQCTMQQRTARTEMDLTKLVCLEGGIAKRILAFRGWLVN
jgi:hypothetical protein